MSGYKLVSWKHRSFISYFKMILKMIDGVSKPALAGLWPNQKGMNVVLDLGANIECDDNNLIDFAELGLLYLNHFFK